MSILILTIALAAGPDLNRVEQVMLAKTNAQRTRHGLPKLTIDTRLQASARKHCAWMTRARRMQHSRGVAENIAHGQRTAVNVIGTWMNSSGHRANILSRRYTKIGVAGYRGRNGRTWWVQQFK